MQAVNPRHTNAPHGPHHAQNASAFTAQVAESKKERGYQRVSHCKTDKTPRHSMVHANAAAEARYMRLMPAAMSRDSPNVRRPARSSAIWRMRMHRRCGT